MSLMFWYSLRTLTELALGTASYHTDHHSLHSFNHIVLVAFLVGYT